MTVRPFLFGIVEVVCMEPSDLELLTLRALRAAPSPKRSAATEEYISANRTILSMSVRVQEASWIAGGALLCSLVSKLQVLNHARSTARGMGPYVLLNAKALAVGIGVACFLCFGASYGIRRLDPKRKNIGATEEYRSQDDGIPVDDDVCSAVQQRAPELLAFGQAWQAVATSCQAFDRRKL